MPSTTALPLVQGTLDLLVLRTLAAGPMHGYGIASLVDERTRGELIIEDAALYQALYRLERKGLVDSEWGTSEKNHRAKYYTITPAGRRAVEEQAVRWRRLSALVNKLLLDEG